MIVCKEGRFVALCVNAFANLQISAKDGAVASDEFLKKNFSVP